VIRAPVRRTCVPVRVDLHCGQLICTVVS